MVPKEATSTAGRTTSTQAKKEQERFAEEILYPLWIAVQREKHEGARPLSQIQKTVQEALGKSSEEKPDFKSIVGNELFASIDEDGKKFYPILDEVSQEISCIRGTMGIADLEAVVSKRRFTATTG